MCSIDGQSSSAASSSLPSTTLCTVVAVVFTQFDDTDRSEIGASSFDASTAIKLVAPTRQLQSCKTLLAQQFKQQQLNTTYPSR